MTDISKESVERLIKEDLTEIAISVGLKVTDHDVKVMTKTADMLRALSARVQELEKALRPEMAETLLSMKAQKCQLITDEVYGWPCGLRFPMNQPPRTDDDWMVVANLDVEDSQFGPRLWDYAISVLNAIQALKGDT